jgi:hypothetical protein
MAALIARIARTRAVRTRGQTRERCLKARPRPKFPIRKPGRAVVTARLDRSVLII